MSKDKLKMNMLYKHINVAKYTFESRLYYFEYTTLMVIMGIGS